MMKIFLLIITAVPMIVMAKAEKPFKSVDGSMRDPSQSLEGPGPSNQIDKYPTGDSIKNHTRIEGCPNCNASIPYLDMNKERIRTADTPTTIKTQQSENVDSEN